MQCPSVHQPLKLHTRPFSKIVNNHAFNLSFHLLILAPFESLKNYRDVALKWSVDYEAAGALSVGFIFTTLRHDRAALEAALAGTPDFHFGAIASVNLTLGRAWCGAC